MKIIDDNMGQWKYPGEVTRIHSKNITMDGVNYDVLGIDAKGNSIMMKPGYQYKFEKGPVTEYPTIGTNGNKSPYEKLIKAQYGYEYDTNQITSEQITSDDFVFNEIQGFQYQPVVPEQQILEEQNNSNNSIIEEKQPIVENNDDEIEDVDTNSVELSFLDEDINPTYKQNDVVYNELYDPDVEITQQILADNGYYDKIIEGYSKEDIKRIQTVLKNKGYDLGTSGPNHDGIDGVYEPKTQNAWNNYNVDGIDGKFTQEALKREQLDMHEQIKRNKAISEGYDGNTTEDVIGKGITENTPLDVVGKGKIKDDDNIEADVEVRNVPVKDSNKITIENESGIQEIQIPQGSTTKESTKDYSGDSSLKKELKEGFESVQSWYEGLKHIFDNPQEYKDVLSFPEDWNLMSYNDKENWYINEVLNKKDEYKKYIGYLPLLASGQEFVMGGGIALDRNDFHIRQSGVTFDFLDFSSEGRTFTSEIREPNGEIDTRCSGGMQNMMLQGGFTDLKKYGIKGDAWEILDNMNASGNSEIKYNAFETYSLGVADSIEKQQENVRKHLRSIVNTDEYKDAMSKIKVGDVVSLYYSGSKKYLVAASAQYNRKNKCYSTYTGVVVKGNNGKMYIWHNSNGNIHMTPLSDAIGGRVKESKGSIQVTGYARMGDGASSIESYYDCSRFGVKPSATAVDLDGKEANIAKYERMFGPVVYRAMGSISSNKETLMSETGITNDSDFDYLYALTLGEMYQESYMGESSTLLEKRFNIKSNKNGGIKQKVNSSVEKFKGKFGNISSKLGLDKKDIQIHVSPVSMSTMQSTGLSNIKPLKNYSEEELKAMGVYDLYFGDELTKEQKHLIQSSPEYSAQMTFRSVAKNAEILDALLEEEGFPEELKVKSKDNEFYTMMMSMIWNQGFYNEHGNNPTATLDTIKKVKYLYDNYGMSEVKNYIKYTTKNNSWGNVRSAVQYLDIDTTGIKDFSIMNNILLDQVVVSPKTKTQRNTNMEYEDYFLSSIAPVSSYTEETERVDADENYEDMYQKELQKQSNIRSARNRYIVGKTNKYLSIMHNSTNFDKSTVAETKERKKKEKEKQQARSEALKFMQDPLLYMIKREGPTIAKEAAKGIKSGVKKVAPRSVKHTYRQIASIIN